MRLLKAIQGNAQVLFCVMNERTMIFSYSKDFYSLLDFVAPTIPRDCQIYLYIMQRKNLSYIGDWNVAETKSITASNFYEKNWPVSIEYRRIIRAYIAWGNRLHNTRCARIYNTEYPANIFQENKQRTAYHLTLPLEEEIRYDPALDWKITAALSSAKPVCPGSLPSDAAAGVTPLCAIKPSSYNYI